MTADNGALRLQADREKRVVALSSVLAAIFLTGMKLVVGLLTGSLGILAEAAHSGLDLVAAAVTFFAVRVSGRPADQVHTYGHGKVENLSALFETFLLLVTCVWIIYEAIQRLFFKSVHVEISIWAFIIMAVSIAIDFTRSRALAAMAKKWDSQALEADALHFSTDIWSSSVVIAGLALVVVARGFNLSWLGNADAVAAMGVAGIVIYVSVQLGKRTIEGLLDAVPPDLRDEIFRVAKVAGVLEVLQVRVRRSGPESFADITLAVRRDLSLEQSHGVASAAEAAVREVLPGADVVVHVEPMRAKDEGIMATVRLLAARNGLGVHNIRFYDVMGNRSLEMHLEVGSNLRLEEAHSQASQFEKALHEALPYVDRIITHLEPAGGPVPARRATPAEEAEVLHVLADLEKEMASEFHPHDIEVSRDNGQLAVSFHCRLDPNEPITAAHAMTERVEEALRDRLPGLGRVMIHVEPATESEP